MTVQLNHRIEGSGPRVLLLHAVGMDLTLLDALTAAMARDFTVLRVDLRGHGRSTYAPTAGLDDYADDVIPGTHYLMFPDAPHMAFFEMPEETASVVGGFFREMLV